MAKKSDLFTSEKEEQTTYSFKIPKPLKERIDAVSAQLEKVSQGKKFAINRILLREMEEAVSLAEAELEAMSKESSPRLPAGEPGADNSAGQIAAVG